MASLVPGPKASATFGGVAIGGGLFATLGAVGGGTTAGIAIGAGAALSATPLFPIGIALLTIGSLSIAYAVKKHEMDKKATHSKKSKKTQKVASKRFNSTKNERKDHKKPAEKTTTSPKINNKKAQVGTPTKSKSPKTPDVSFSAFSDTDLSSSCCSEEFKISSS